MKNIMNKYLLIIAFIAGSLLVISLSRSSKNTEIDNLIKDNKFLLAKNDSLSKQNDSLKYNLDNSNSIILSLNKKDNLLKEKIVYLNNKIQNVKYEYEKANNHANNFNSLDIQRYFSELK